MPFRLQCLDVPIIDEEACKNAYPDMITRRMVCAGYMDGGRDACNVSFQIFQMVTGLKGLYVKGSLSLSTPHSVLIRVTLAVLWCVLENSTVWCHGVRDVPCLTTLVSTLKCVSSFTGLKTSWQPTPKEITRFPTSLPPCAFIFSLPYDLPFIPILSPSSYFSVFPWWLVSFEVFSLTHPDSTNVSEHRKHNKAIWLVFTSLVCSHFPARK